MWMEWARIVARIGKYVQISIAMEIPRNKGGWVYIDTQKSMRMVG